MIPVLNLQPQGNLPQDRLPQGRLPQGGLPQDRLPQDGLPQAAALNARLRVGTFHRSAYGATALRSIPVKGGCAPRRNRQGRYRLS